MEPEAVTMERNMRKHLEMSPGEAARLRLERYMQEYAERELGHLLPVMIGVTDKTTGKVTFRRENGAYWDPVGRKIVKPEEEAEERAKETVRIQELLMEAITSQTEAPAFKDTFMPPDLARIEREMKKHRLESPPVTMTDWDGMLRYTSSLMENRCWVCGRVIVGGGVCGMCRMFMEVGDL